MFETILIAYDGSAHADKAVEVAEELGTKFGATIHLVHVITHEHATADVKKFARTEHATDPDRLELVADWARHLKPIEAKLRSDGAKAVHSAVLRSDATEQILEHANKVSAELIVMGRRGLGRVEGLLVGSVSSKLSSLANCPVVTVK